jgi:hypothetical protein
VTIEKRKIKCLEAENKELKDYSLKLSDELAKRDCDQLGIGNNRLMIEANTKLISELSERIEFLEKYCHRHDTQTWSKFMKKGW